MKGSITTRQAPFGIQKANKELDLRVLEELGGLNFDLFCNQAALPKQLLIMFDIEFPSVGQHIKSEAPRLHGAPSDALSVIKSAIRASRYNQIV